jgi:hypothetical protein
MLAPRDGARTGTGENLFPQLILGRAIVRIEATPALG